MKYRVQIFMSTYNGEKYLREQIDSILNQENVNVNILVRDDGSSDNTIEILKEYKEKGVLNYYCGENIGYAKSFLHLLSHNVKADYYAFCDQDDVWLSHKLINAVEKIKRKNIPMLYASSLNRVDESLNFLNKQSFKNLKITLGAEFTRHRLAGCTFVFNNKLYEIIKNTYNIKNLNCSHDKLIVILCLIMGGEIFFDNNSYILFRRYGNNTSIDGKSIFKKILKEKEHFTKYKHNESNLAKCILEYYGKQIDKENFELLFRIANYRNNIVDYIRLIFSKELDCGFWFYNIFIKLIIICRCF